MLKADRDVQRSLAATERAHRKTQATATTAAQRAGQAAVKAAGLYGREGAAVAEVAGELSELNAAQARALTTTNRALVSQARLVTAYNRTAEAAKRTSVAERLRARAMTTGKGAAVGAGAAAGRVSAATAGIGAAVGFGGAIAIKQAATYQQSLANVQARLLTNHATMAKLDKLALKLGADTQFSANDAADAMGELAAQGFNAHKIMRILPGTLSLAAASGTDLASAAEIQTSTLHGFGLAAGQANHVADVLAQTANKSAADIGSMADSLKYIGPVAHTFNQSLEDMGASVGLLANVGIKGEQAGTTIRRALVQLVKPSGKTIDTLDAAGISMGDFSRITTTAGGKMRPLPQIIGRLAAATDKLGGREKRRVIAQLFGVEALPGVLALLSKGQGKIEKLSGSLTHSQGAAKRTANIMRNTVAGAFDNLTGSVETASITLLKRFAPAAQTALNAGAKGVNGLVRGLTGAGDARGAVSRGPGGRVENVAAAPEASGAAKVGAKIREVAGTIGTAAISAGRQLLDAFKPAQPFLANVLLPLLKGIAEGILGSVVGAFKVLVPIIKVAATVLGAIGKVAAPLKPVFEGIGKVIGFLAGGPILGFLNRIGKVGKVVEETGQVVWTASGRLGHLTSVFKVLAAPINVVGKVFGWFGGKVADVAKGLAGPVAAAFHGIGSVAKTVGGIVAKGFRLWISAHAAVAKVLVPGIANTVGKVAGVAKGIIGALTSPIRAALGIIGNLGGKFLAVGKGLVGMLVKGLKGAGAGIARALGSAAGFAADIGRSVANWLNDHTPFGNHIGIHVLGKDVGFDLPMLRRGGRVPRFAAGGRVPILASGGELVVDGGRATPVPGPSDRDGTLMMARPGAAVLTASGQAMMAAGASMAQALAGQAPHFAKGGRVTAGHYLSTAYGPPWGGINGGGTTATGVNLKGSPHRYGVAVDPRLIPLGSNVHVSPNPFGTAHAFTAFDTGGAIKGRRLDFYDWRGRQAQMAWGRRGVTVGTSSSRGVTGKALTHDQSVRVPIRLGRSKTRAGLLGDAFDRGRTAATEGISRYWTRAQMLADQAGTRTATTRKITTPGLSSSGSSGSTSVKGDSTGRVGRMVAFAKSASAKFPRYVYGGGHASFAGPYDCSGFASAILHAGGFLSSPTDTTGLKRFGAAGNGKLVTVGVRGSYGRNAHTMVRLGGRYFEAGSSGVGQRTGWSGSFPIRRHPRGYRTGGRVGSAPPKSVAMRLARSRAGLAQLSMLDPRVVGQGFRAGGTVGRLVGTLGSSGAVTGPTTYGLGRGVSRAIAFAPNSINALDDMLGGAVEGRLEALRRSLLAKVRKGGNAKTVQRIQQVLDFVDAELGRRVGKLERGITRRTDTQGTVAATSDAFMRRHGIDASSSRGIGLERSVESANLTTLRANAKDTRHAIKIATKAGQTGVANELRSSLKDLNAGIVESVTRRIELARQAVAAKAQERVDAAQFGTDFANAGSAALEASQRVYGTSNTPGGMRERAGFITGQIIPALQAQLAASQAQAGVAWKQGDVSGFGAAVLAASQASTDLANAMADAGDLMRQAATQAAQDLVDTAVHGETMASAGLTSLELRQKIAGTYDNGGQERADYITTVIQPAIRAELDALTAQQAEAQREGDTALANTIAEALAGKQNDLLQSIVDATEETASNTEPRRFGGTLGFSYGGETLTDTLVTAGNGF